MAPSGSRDIPEKPPRSSGDSGNHRSHYIALALGLTLVLALRLFLVVGHENYLGVDGGQYLLSAREVLGESATNEGFIRPPLAPGWLLVPFTQTLGYGLGLKVWYAVTSMLPLLGVWLVSRLFLPAWLTLLALAFISLDTLQTEMLVTGTLPMVGFSLLLVVVWACWKLYSPHQFHWKYVGVIALSIPLIALINQTTAGMALVLVPVFLGAMVFLTPSSLPKWLRLPLTPICLLPITLSLLIGGLISLSALPWYLPLIPGGEHTQYQGPFLYLAAFPYDPAWLLNLLALPISYFLFKWGGEANEPRLRAYGVLIAASSLLTLFYSTDESLINIFYRNRYLLPLLWYPGLLWVIREASRRKALPTINKKVLIPALGIILALALLNHVRVFNVQSGYSDQITTDTEALMETINPDEGSIITSSFSMSLWVAGLMNTPSPSVWTWEPPRAYNAEDYHVRCLLGWVGNSEEVYLPDGMNLVLRGPRGSERESCNPVESARVLNAAYVLIDTRFPHYKPQLPGNYKAPANQWEVTAQAPWLTLVGEKGKTKLWRVNTDG